MGSVAGTGKEEIGGESPKSHSRRRANKGLCRPEVSTQPRRSGSPRTIRPSGSESGSEMRAPPGRPCWTGAATRKPRRKRSGGPHS
eukprot:3118447-Heterocapsa_arctica.AAC.1